MNCFGTQRIYTKHRTDLETDMHSPYTTQPQTDIQKETYLCQSFGFNYRAFRFLHLFLRLCVSCLYLSFEENVFIFCGSLYYARNDVAYAVHTA